MKYIIEIEEMPFTSEGSEMQLFKATEFNSLVFDRNGLEKLTPYDESAEKQRIYEEMWGFVRAIAFMTYGELDEAGIPQMWGKESCYEEIREKYDAWKKQKDEIKVGDEVKRQDDTATFVVTSKTDSNMYEGFTNTGVVLGGYNVYKTGRHFPEVAKVLNKMRCSKTCGEKE